MATTTPTSLAVTSSTSPTPRRARCPSGRLIAGTLSGLAIRTPATGVFYPPVLPKSAETDEAVPGGLFRRRRSREKPEEDTARDKCTRERARQRKRPAVGAAKEDTSIPDDVMAEDDVEVRDRVGECGQKKEGMVQSTIPTGDEWGMTTEMHCRMPPPNLDRIRRDLRETCMQMMYVSGETGEPSLETLAIIEEIVRQQVIELVRPSFPSPHSSAIRC